MESDQHWYLQDGPSGPLTTAHLETLWQSHQIDSLSQIARSPDGPWNHIMQNIDLMNTFIDLQFQEKALQSVHVQTHLTQLKPDAGPPPDSRLLRLKQLVKAHKTFKAIEQHAGPLEEEDKATILKEIKKAKKLEKQKIKQKAMKASAKANTSIYIKGLPDDVTLAELQEFFSKAGVIKTDLDSGESKIKVYKDEQGRVKGDALVSYIKPESVELAIQMLHDRYLRADFKLVVEEASFKNNVPTVDKPIDKQKCRLNKIKARSEQERMFSWGEEGTISSGLLIVQISNLYDSLDPQEADELAQDLKEECQDKLGPVQRVKLFPQNPKGVALIKFKQAEHARGCVDLMQGRWFNERQLACDYYDGHTDHNRDGQPDDQIRITQFGDWLDQQ